jgi:C4-dicarboxylate transporter DctM subunit
MNLTTVLTGSFILLLLLGVPVAVSLGIATLFALLLTGIPIVMLAQTVFAAADSFPLIAIPLFILAGSLMETGGLSRRLIAVFTSLTGHIPGGLAIVTILACMFFAAISGSGPATTAAIGTIMIPAMVRRNYDSNFAGAAAASGGTLGILIPPSIPMIIYGISAEQSIAKLFTAGFIPGILVGAVLTLTAYVLSRQRGYLGSAESFRWENFLLALCRGKWSLAAPVIILGGIYAGIVTPTESAVIAVVYGFLVGFFIYRELTLSETIRALKFSATTSGVVLFIMGTATAFGQLMTRYHIPDKVAEAIASLSSSPFVILMLINALLIFVGMWMDTLAQIILLTPLLLPVVMKVGVDPIHFGILFVINCEIGFLTPPVGVNLFVSMGLTGTSLEAISRAALPFVVSLILAVTLLTLFPQVSLFLPRLIGMP